MSKAHSARPRLWAPLVRSARASFPVRWATWPRAQPMAASRTWWRRPPGTSTSPRSGTMRSTARSCWRRCPSTSSSELPLQGSLREARPRSSTGWPRPSLERQRRRMRPLRARSGRRLATRPRAGGSVTSRARRAARRSLARALASPTSSSESSWPSRGPPRLPMPRWARRRRPPMKPRPGRWWPVTRASAERLRSRGWRGAARASRRPSYASPPRR